MRVAGYREAALIERRHLEKVLLVLAIASGAHDGPLPCRLAIAGTVDATIRPTLKKRY